MNLNVNHTKILAYLKAYVGENMPGRNVTADKLGMPQSTFQSSLIGLERGGMILLGPADKTLPPCQQKREVLFCADLPETPANHGYGESDQAEWQRRRKEAIAGGTRR